MNDSLKTTANIPEHENLNEVGELISKATEHNLFFGLLVTTIVAVLIYLVRELTKKDKLIQSEQAELKKKNERIEELHEKMTGLLLDSQEKTLAAMNGLSRAIEKLEIELRTKHK